MTSDELLKHSLASAGLSASIFMERDDCGRGDEYRETNTALLSRTKAYNNVSYLSNLRVIVKILVFRNTEYLQGLGKEGKGVICNEVEENVCCQNS